MKNTLESTRIIYTQEQAIKDAEVEQEYFFKRQK